MRSTLLLSILAVSLGGCGDHGLPSDDMTVFEDMSAELDMGIPDDAKHIVSFSMFAQDFAQALCAHYMKCGLVDAAQLNACIENNLRHTGWDQDVEIMKGRLEINELQCLTAVQTSRCDNSDINAWSTRCLQFLYSGHVANGGACIADVECESSYCEHGSSDAGVQVTGCPGTCATPKSPGAPCRLNTDCDAKSICDSGGTNKCVELAPVNQPCTNFLGAGTGPGCQTGLLCPTFPSTASPTCVVPTMQTAVGQACDPFQGAATPTPGCAAGLYCQLQYTTTTTACTVATQSTDCTGVGSYCDPTALVCKNLTGGKCATKVASGADCDPNNDGMFAFVNSQCADGTQCAQLGTQTKSTCQAFGGANADCLSTANCKIGFYCDGTTNKCTAWAADGQSCADTSQCASETQQTVCIADNADAGTATTCQVTKNVGTACNPGFEDSLCEPSDLPGSTACVPNGSGGGTCAPKCF